MKICGADTCARCVVFTTSSSSDNTRVKPATAAELASSVLGARRWGGGDPALLFQYELCIIVTVSYLITIQVPWFPSLLNLKERFTSIFNKQNIGFLLMGSIFYFFKEELSSTSLRIS